MLVELFKVERNPDLRHRIDSCWDHYDLGVLHAFGLNNIGIDATRNRVTYEFKKGDSICVDIDVSEEGVNAQVYEAMKWGDAPDTIITSAGGELEIEFIDIEEPNYEEAEFTVAWELHDWVVKAVERLEEKLHGLD